MADSCRRGLSEMNVPLGEGLCFGQWITGYRKSMVLVSGFLSSGYVFYHF
jgi:hypothetical protein